MPRRSGLDLARELHRRDPLLAIILCSGCVADIDPGEVDACGIDCVISKPLSPQALAGVLGEQVPA